MFPFIRKNERKSEDTLDREKSLIRRENDMYRKELDFDARQANFEARKKLTEDYIQKVGEEKNALAALREEGAEQIADFEHEYHSHMEDKRTAMAKADAELEFKKKLLDTVKDTNQEIFDAKMKSAKDAYEVVLKTKDEVIEILKQQVEILTAKLTEIKIDSVHLNANIKAQTDKK